MFKRKVLSHLLGTLALAASLDAAAQNAGNTLRDFYTSALGYSPAIKAAEARWQASDARKSYATGTLLPQVGVSGEVSDNTSDYRGQTLDYRGKRYSLQLSQVLFNWQAFTNRQVASLQENQLEAEYYAQLALTLTVIADEYLLVLQTEDNLRSINSELEAINNQVNQIQQLYNRQLAKITDLYQGQAQQASVQTQLVTAQSDLNIARENLRAASGLDVGNLHRLPALTSVTPLDGTLDEWLAKAKANNKQIEAGNFALKAADKSVSERMGAYLPKISLVVQRQTSDVGYNNVPVDRNENSYVGVNFQMPLFAGGSNRALVREAQSQRTQAEAQLQQTSLDVLDRARTAYFKVKAGESRIEAARKLAESTATAYNAMKRGFEVGTVTSVDVLNALRDQFRAQRELQQARYDQIRFTLILQREAGSLSAADLEKVSEQLNAPAASP